MHVFKMETRGLLKLTEESLRYKFGELEHTSGHEMSTQPTLQALLH